MVQGIGVADPLGSRQGLATFLDALDERDMSLLLTRLKDDRMHVLSDLVESGQVGGLIVIGQLTLHDYLNELTRNGFPMVVWGAPLPDAVYPVVGGDNAMGGYLATRHLIEQGCRRIAFFGDISHPEAGQRYQGYARALQEANIPQDPRLLQSFLFGAPLGGSRGRRECLRQSAPADIFGDDGFFLRGGRPGLRLNLADRADRREVLAILLFQSTFADAVGVSDPVVARVERDYLARSGGRRMYFSLTSSHA